MVSVPSKLSTKPQTRVPSSAEQFFPGSGVAASKRSESRSGYSSAIKMPPVKSSRNFAFFCFASAFKAL